MPHATACSNEGKKVVTVTPQTKTGKPTTLDGNLVVSVQSGDGTFKYDPAVAPNDVEVISGDLMADTVYLVKGDADRGAGVVEIQDTITLTVTSAQANAFGFSSGPEVPKA